MSEPFDIRIQRVAEEHLRACNDALYESDEDDDNQPLSPASAPFCGCDTCVVREVLSVAWTELVREAERLVAERASREPAVHIRPDVQETAR